eukprot:366072-Chlamydomonas_euryale.AAC.4
MCTVCPSPRPSPLCLDAEPFPAQLPATPTASPTSPQHRSLSGARRKPRHAALGCEAAEHLPRLPCSGTLATVDSWSVEPHDTAQCVCVPGGEGHAGKPVGRGDC